ncbi:unnamed protein product [Parnassius mnemosyne]|uniref:Reverse transcriptase domain-containing protein n=1 Tax=Parnassius mnemosyne TaxID=213953 RepID=A0AAV1M3E6_9NEOP
MASIDLKDAYFLIPIYNSHRKYLKFDLNGILYEFNCLPFGLSTAPYLFTKLLKPVVEYFRLNNIITVIYLDDLLLFGNSYAESNKNIVFIKNVFENLGLLIKYEKSCLVPSTKCKFLGFIFDSVNMRLELPDDKRLKIYNLLMKFMSTINCNLREYAKFLGTLISICPAIELFMVIHKTVRTF